MKNAILIFSLICFSSLTFGQTNIQLLRNQYMSNISIMYLDLSIKGHVLNLKDSCGNLVPYKKEIT